MSRLFLISRHIVSETRRESYINENHIEWANWIFLLISIASSFLYYRVYGGYAGYLQYASKVRMGVFLIHNPFSFLIIFRNFAILSTFLSFARLHCGRGVKCRDVILLVVSLVYSVMTLYSNQGRVAFAFFFLVLI